MEKTQNLFYISDFRFFVFESLEKATELVKINDHLKISSFYATKGEIAPNSFLISLIERNIKSQVLLSQKNVPILVIKKRNFYWHVIIGDKFGWIILNKKTPVRKMIV